MATGTTTTFVTITGPPVSTQDADGNWTTTITYSDASTYSWFSGPSLPDIRQAVQAASVNVAANQNQPALIAIGAIPDPSALPAA